MSFFPTVSKLWLILKEHQGMKQLLCSDKSSQWKQPTSVLFNQTRPHFPDSVTERNFTLIISQSWLPVIDCLQEINVLNKVKFSPLFPVSVMANHSIWHHFLNQSFLQYDLQRPSSCYYPGKIKGGHAIGSLSISLYFKSLCIIISHHLPCLVSEAVAVFHLLWAPPLALWTSSCLPLLSHQSPPLTSSFLLVCKSFHPQIPSSTTDTPSSYHSVSFLPSAELLLDFLCIL